MSKILHLPLKKEWYEMIESGVKTEEYRENKPYWVRRLTTMRCRYILFSHRGGYSHIEFKQFDRIKFSYGYTKRTMTFECKEITFGEGKKEWGAPNEEVFIIKLGNRIE